MPSENMEASLAPQIDIHSLVTLVLELAADRPATVARLRNWAIGELKRTTAAETRDVQSESNSLTERPRRGRPPTKGASKLSARPETAVAERWVSTKEAAEHLGVAPKTLSNWRHKDRHLPPHAWKGPPFKGKGNVPRYRISDLDAWMKRAGRS